MKRQDEAVTYSGKEAGRVLHIVHVDFPPGQVLFSFGRCNQIRSMLMDTVNRIQQSSMVCAHPICNASHGQSCADSKKKGVTSSS